MRRGVRAGVLAHEEALDALVRAAGSSAGQHAANVLVEIHDAALLTPAFPAAIFVVIHTSPSSPGVLDLLLTKRGPLAAHYAVDGEAIRASEIYLASPDCHLIVKPDRVRAVRGPRENRFRPALDPLFRTAAIAYGPRVIGVVLSGGNDDGAIGLGLIKRQGGIANENDEREDP